MSSKRDEDIARRFLEAEKLWKIHHHVEKPKIKYFKTYCPKCQKKVEYFPRRNFKGRLKCPHCYHEFTIFRLTDF